MKYMILCLCLFCTTVSAQDEGIAVNGKALIEVQADIMTWSLQVTTEGEILQDVASGQLNHMNAVSAMLIAAGIDPKDLEVTDMSFGERYSFSNRQRVRDGYTANSQIIFSLKDFSLYQNVWMELSKFNAVSVRSIGFDHSEKIALRNKARIQAIEAAREKAQKMAEALNVRLGKPLSLSETTPWSPAVSHNRMANVAMVNEEAGMPQGTAFGKIRIEARVQARFAIQD